jgi:hypothetical protein
MIQEEFSQTHGTSEPSGVVKENILGIREKKRDACVVSQYW